MDTATMVALIPLIEFLIEKILEIEKSNRTGNEKHKELLKAVESNPDTKREVGKNLSTIDPLIHTLVKAFNKNGLFKE
jgi:hypothetical protein